MLHIMVETVPHIINDTHNGVRMAEWSKMHRLEYFVIIVVLDSGRTRPRNFLKAIENHFSLIVVEDGFVSNKIDLKSKINK